MTAMVRGVIGGAAGAAAGLVALAACGAYYGATEGVATARIPPGIEAALLESFVFPVFFFWAAMPVGGLIGAAAGFASAAARPRT